MRRGITHIIIGLIILVAGWTAWSYLTSPSPALKASRATDYATPIPAAAFSPSPTTVVAPSPVKAAAVTPIGLPPTTFGQTGPVTLTDIPAGRFQIQLAKLPESARSKALKKLEKLQIPLNNVRSLNVDSNGDLFYACFSPSIPGELPAASGQPPRPVAPPAPPSNPAASQGAQSANSLTAQNGAIPANADSPQTSTSSNAVSAGAAVPITSPPIRHSKPGSTKVIYLDFNGQVITGTQWNDDANVPAYECLPYDTDAQPTTFSDTEQADIVEIWERVAEAYRGFDVDVTTEEPAVFTTQTARVLITSTEDALGIPLPSSVTASGVAYIDKFGAADFVTKTSPTFVYYEKLTTPANIALGAAHEVGHNMGLFHDGTTNSEYYTGHGSGDTSWGPIMGAPYNRNVTQWSNGEYLASNNPQDDVQLIAIKLAFRTDDSSAVLANANSVTVDQLAFSASGIIEKNDDEDLFKFVSSQPFVKLRVSPFRGESDAHGTTLDAKVELLDSTGSVVATSNPQDTTDLSLNNPVTPGATYYLRVSAAGTGTPLVNPPSGYTIYGNAGSYALSGSFGSALPTRQTPLVGSSFNLSVEPGGTGPFTYVWTQNGKVIPGQTTGTFSFPAIALSDAGYYRVQITDANNVASDAYSFVLPRPANSQVVAWGTTDPSTDPLQVPTPISVPDGIINPIAAAGGYTHALALAANGTVVAWGDNTYGQSSVPGGLSDVVAINAGAYHSLALKSDGKIQAWGGNWVGQSTIPANLENVVAIAGGFAHSLALKSDGTVVAWGDNTKGQRNVPPGLTGVVAIAAGDFHSVALKADGTVMAWGDNDINYKQIDIPPGLTTVVAIAAASGSTSALKADGTVAHWGYHYDFLPVPLGLANVVAIAGGGFHDLAVKSDGLVVAWGYPGKGQIAVPALLNNVFAVEGGFNFSLALQNTSSDQKPQITANPANAVARVGEVATFTVAAEGIGTLSYQWKKGNADLAGETNSTLTINPVTLTDAGTYRAVVTNAFGSANSAAATLTVDTTLIPPPDVVLPVVTLAASPKANAKFKTKTPTFSGTIKEAGAMDLLEYQINNSGNWFAISHGLVKAGTYTFSGPVELDPGANSVTFRAKDGAGNISKLVTRRVYFLFAQPLTLTAPAVTDGTLTKGFVGSERYVGYNYSITAAPAKNKIFKEWLVTSGGNTTSVRSKKLIFTMQEDTEITPVFVDNFFIPAAGNYIGVFGDGSIVAPDALAKFNQRNGLANFTLGATGAFSGNVAIGGKTLKFKGKFDGFGEVILTLKYDANRFITLGPLKLTPAVAPNVASISSTTAFDGNPITLTAHRAFPYTGIAPDVFPGAGRYNIALVVNGPPPSIGHGYSSVVISPKGVTSFAGMLPDGIRFTASSRIVEKSTAADEWTIPISRAVAPGTSGLLHGEGVFPQNPLPDAPDISTTLSWLHAPNIKTLFFPNGLLATMDVVGSKWTVIKNVKVLTGDPSLPFDPTVFTLTLDPEMGVLPIEISQPGSWPTTNKPTLTPNPVLPKGLSFSYNPTTGVITGKVIKPGLPSPVSLTYRGILFASPIEEVPNLIYGLGYLYDGIQSGKVQVTVPIP